jgi:hypothetical protein
VEAVARSFRFIAYSSRYVKNHWCIRGRAAILYARDKETNIMKTPGKHAPLPSDRARKLRTDLASKIASFMGSEENRATDIPGLTLHRRIAPTAPCSMTYEPGVTVIAQGLGKFARSSAY